MSISTLPINKQILFRTSSATSVLDQGGVIKVGGLNDVNKANLINITQVNYRAEVAQVITVGSNSYTPVGATNYEISVFDPNRIVSGYNEPIKYYGYTTPDDITELGATAALQREAIHVAIIAKVNLDPTNHAVAATLATGTGFTITDDGGYYPPHAQTMTNVLFVNQVLAISGFTAAPTVTTAGVTSSGVGANLAAEVAVTDYMNGGNLTSGYRIYPKTLAGLAAVSGQQYNAFIVNSLAPASIPENISGQLLAFVDSSQTIWIDNGTGSSVTNLAGYLAAERVLHKLMYQVYEKDLASIGEFFDKGYVMQANPGITPYTGTLASTADVMKFFTTPYGTKLEQYNINTQTIFAPLEVASGLQIEQDVTATDGAHYCAGTLAYAPNSFIVGQQSFSVYARVVAGDWTDAFAMVGFRNKAAYAADYTTYDDLGAIGTRLSAVGDVVATQGNINNGTTVETASAVVIAADSVSVLLKVSVAIDGTVTAYRDGVSFPIYSAGTTTLVFTAGDEMIPFYQFINVNSSASTFTISEFIAVADNGSLIS